MCNPEQSIKYSWDQPGFTDKHLLMIIENKEFQLDLTEIGKRANFKIKASDARA